jgi:hypothetical protein
MRSGEVLILVIGILRALVWLVGSATAGYAIGHAMHSWWINVSIAIGCFGLAVATGLSAPLLAGYHVPQIVGDLTTLLSFPSAILVVGGLWFRVQESRRIRKSLEDLSRIAAVPFPDESR